MVFLFFVCNSVQMCYNVDIKCRFFGYFEYSKTETDEAIRKK